MTNLRGCSIPGCDKPHDAHGYCRVHYYRWRQHGDPMGGRVAPGVVVSFFADVVLPYEGDECLVWPYARGRHGYARMTVNGRRVNTPRAVCEAKHGPPPTPKHEAAHSCGRGHLGCVTPAHVRWATHAENMADKLLHGTDQRGERNHHAKLTEDDVRRIRGMEGALPRAHIARLFGVGRPTISSIHARKLWGWLPEGPGDTPIKVVAK